MHTTASPSPELLPCESYTTAANIPYSRDPIGMFVIKMLWLTPKLFGPNSSAVIETAAANMNPELKPINAVPMYTANALDDADSRKNAMGVGIRAIESHPVLAKYNFLQRKSNWSCEKIKAEEHRREFELNRDY